MGCKLEQQDEEMTSREYISVFVYPLDVLTDELQRVVELSLPECFLSNRLEVSLHLYWSHSACKWINGFCFADQQHTKLVKNLVV